MNVKIVARELQYQDLRFKRELSIFIKNIV